jgi:hypothetical protein
MICIIKKIKILNNKILFKKNISIIIMDIYTYYVTFIFIIKIIYLTIALLAIYFTHKKNDKLVSKFTFWKEHVEFLFIALMSVLLVVLFNPFMNNLKLIDRETKLLLFLYGIIIILNADWRLFFKESKILHL